MKHLTTSGYTCEIALEKIPNKFEFIIIAAERARQLTAGKRSKFNSPYTPLVTAIKEIEQGKYTIEDFNEYMAELRAESIALQTRFRNRSK